MNIKLLKNANVYAPKYLGKKDILIGYGKIIKIDDEINISGLDVEVIDFKEDYLFPGFIDNHVHITGGGGEGGFKYRTPEIKLTDITLAGVTTVIGVIGTDGTTRVMTNLLAKVKSLREEGVSAYCLSGSYEIPPMTLTNSIVDDLILFEEIIGVGEVAISDHRATAPTVEELSKVATKVRLGGMISGKGGVVNVHLGDGKNGIELLYKVLENTDLPIKHFVPTHMNRNFKLYKSGLLWTGRGGFVDFTTSTTEKFLAEGEIKCSDAMLEYDKFCLLDMVTLSSDGQGSLPEFDEAGELVGLGVGSCKSILKEIVDAIKDGLDISKAISVATINPARAYNLQNKGQIKENFDADIIRLNKDFEIIDVYAMSRTMVKDKIAIVKGTYE